MFRYASLVATTAAFLLANPLAAQDVRTTLQSPDSLVPVTQLLSVASASVVSVAPVALAPNAGPTMQSSIAGVRTQSDAATPVPYVADDRVGRNPALMIVGGAALIVGAIIGGDAGTIVMVGGAVTGLVGLWNFLR
ncbi:MAG: hypothetical protein ABI910_09230 [Gemmatimonadota bacterium]